MVRKPEAPAPAPEAPARRVITQKRLRSLMGVARQASKDVASINGEYREEIANAVAKHHLNKRMFRIIMVLDKLEAEDLRRDLEDLEHYLDISGLKTRAESAPALALTMGEGEEGEEGEENVVHLGEAAE